MLIKPSPRDALRGVPVTVRIETHRLTRVEQPEKEERLFAEASCAALKLVAPEGCNAVSFESVAEFIVADGERVAYRYVWIFSAWDLGDDDS